MASQSASDDVISRSEMLQQMRRSAEPSTSYFTMLSLATLISTFGLIANSSPAIIGAMIIAPLMSPIMSLAYGLVSRESLLIGPSLISVGSGTVLVIALAYLTTEILGLRIVRDEILARTSPTLIDLGVAVAAGAAGAFACARTSIMNSIAGVAIAVALVPPLAVTGIGLSMGRDAIADNTLSLSVIGLYAGGEAIAGGAFVLFFTNLIGIVFIAILVFFSQRYGNWKRTLAAMLLCMSISALVFTPLVEAFRSLHLRDETMRAISATSEERPDILPSIVKLEPARISYRDGVPHIYLQVLGPRTNAEQLEQGAELIRSNISANTGLPVVLQLDFIGVDLLQLIARGGDSSDSR